MLLYIDSAGPLLSYDRNRGMLKVEDLNPHVQTEWAMSRWEMVRTGLRFIVAAFVR